MDFNSQIQQLMREKEHAKALAIYDSHLSLDKSSKDHQRGLLKAMQEASFDHTLEQYQKNCMQSLQAWNNDMTEVKELLLKRNDEEFDDKVNAISLDVTLDQGHAGVMSSIHQSMAKMKILQEMKVLYKAIDIDANDSAEKVNSSALSKI